MSSGLENKLRAALRDTAGEIPADPPPAAAAPGRARAPPRPVRPGQRRWISWAAPLAAAAVVLAVVAASLAVVRSAVRAHHERTARPRPSSRRTTSR